MLRKKHLTEEEYKELFAIIKPNMERLNVSVTEKDYSVWVNNLRKLLVNPEYYFYILYLEDSICGLVSLIRNDDKLTLCEIQLNDRVKQTRMIINVLRYLYKAKEFTGDNCVYFSIKKNNSISNHTFTHLGGELIDETDNNYKYKLTREKMGEYLSKFAKYY